MDNVQKRWFITVERCKNGYRGIFCDRQGNCCVQDTQHTDDEMAEKLGQFWIVLDPISVEMTEEEVAKYTKWVPLAEYMHQWGIALKGINL